MVKAISAPFTRLFIKRMQVYANMKTILITNMFFRDYSGSELSVLDIAREFTAQGYKVDIAAFEFNMPLKQDIARDDAISIIDLTSKIALDRYDIIWAQHWPALTQAIKLGARSKKIIFCSLSPYESVERLPSYRDRLSICLANSYETQQARNSTPDRSKVFLNSVKDSFFNYKIKKPSKLKKIAFIGNTRFTNQDEFTDFFTQKNIAVTCFGMYHENFVHVTPEVLAEFDLVVTIGRTVQYCLSLGLPVYCYGRFGGDGYISQDRFELNEDFNFSGRVKTIDYDNLEPNLVDSVVVKKIGQDIIDGYQANLENLDDFKKRAKARYNLAHNIQTVLKNLGEVDVAALKESQEFKDEYQNLYFVIQKFDNENLIINNMIHKNSRKVKKLRKIIIGLSLIIAALLIYNLVL